MDRRIVSQFGLGIMEAGGAGFAMFVTLLSGPIDYGLINVREGSDFVHGLAGGLVPMPGKNDRPASRQTSARWQEDEKAARQTICLN